MAVTACRFENVHIPFMHRIFFPDVHVVINLYIIHDKRRIVKSTHTTDLCELLRLV